MFVKLGELQQWSFQRIKRTDARHHFVTPCRQNERIERGSSTLEPARRRTMKLDVIEQKIRDLEDLARNLADLSAQLIETALLLRSVIDSEPDQVQ